MAGLQQSLIKRHLILFRDVDLIAQIAGEADPQNLGLQPRDRHLTRPHEAEVIVTDVLIGQSPEQVAGRWTSHVEPGEAAGHTLERHRVRTRHGIEIAAMVAFGHARTDHQEVLLTQHGDGEIPRDPAAHRQQRRQAGFADLDRDPIGNNPVEPGGRAPALDLVLAEVGDIDDADA